MTCGNPRQDGTGHSPFAPDSFSGGNRSQRAGCGNTKRIHRLGDHIFTQYGSQPGAAIPLAGVGRAPRSFELDIVALPILSQNLSEQQSTAIAQLWIEIPKLMPGIGLRQRISPLWHAIAGKSLCHFINLTGRHL